jgi:hypothetical protein
MSTDQTHDEQLAEGQHRFGHHGDDDDVLEGQLIEPGTGSDEDPAVAAANDPNRPVDDPIVMDNAPVDPEDDRVVLDSRDDAMDAAVPDPASPAAAGYEDRDGSYGSDGATTANSAIPMPGGSATGATSLAADGSPAETTMDDGTLDGAAPVSGTETDAIPAATPAAGAPVATAETSEATGQPVTGTASATADRVAGTEQWNEIKAMFVDDPRAATQRAASLVDGSVEALLASIKGQQQSMQSEWQGDGADTEKLRTALQRYRSFWTRLEEFSRPA